MADIEWVWMKHPEGTEAAPFAPDAAEFWQARGWEITEKPEEPDPTVEPALYRFTEPVADGEEFIPRRDRGRDAETTTDTKPVEKNTTKSAGRRRAGSEESGSAAS